MSLTVIGLNVLGWPILQLSLARIFLAIPDKYLAHDSWLTRERSFERGGQLYSRGLWIRRWKRMLPDGAPWLGGRPKRWSETRGVAELKILSMETRRSEAAHWCMLLCSPIFYLWNPPWACAVMTCYGVIANLPCILAQRANRMRIARILARASCERLFVSACSCPTAVSDRLVR